MRTSARRRLLQILVAAVVGTASFVGAAFAYSEYYGNYWSNTYIQTSGAHTFVNNAGQGSGNAAIACQLFQYSGGFNRVDHGNGVCGTTAPGNIYVWGRVYNQSGVSAYLSGFANT